MAASMCSPVVQKKSSFWPLTLRYRAKSGTRSICFSAAQKTICSVALPFTSLMFP